MSETARDGAPNGIARLGRSRIAGTLLLGVTLIAIAVITLSPADESARLPFWCFRCGTRPAIDVLLNILMFVPVGASLGLLHVRARRTIAIIVLITVIIEALQFTVIPGRFASARDIIMNTLGGIMGWQLALGWRALVRPPPRRAHAFALTAALSWIASQAFTAWAMGVVLPPTPWWAQIRLRDLGFPSVFTGEVVRLWVDTIPIVYSDQLENGDAVRARLLKTGMGGVVTRVKPTAGAAPIFLLATDDTLSEIAGLVQDGRDVFFRIRTRAAVVGLRNPGVRLHSVFSPTPGDAPITIGGGRVKGRYVVMAQQGSAPLTRDLAVSPSWTWALLMPVPHYAFGAEVRWVTAGWLFVMLSIMTFWSAQRPIGMGRVRAARAWTAGLAAAAMIAGLAVVPLLFGLPVAHWSEWLAALAGAFVGAGIGKRIEARRSRALP